MQKRKDLQSVNAYSIKKLSSQLFDQKLTVLQSQTTDQSQIQNRRKNGFRDNQPEKQNRKSSKPAQLSKVIKNKAQIASFAQKRQKSQSISKYIICQKLPLNHFYDGISGGINSFSKLNYLNSLIPSVDTLKKTRRLTIKVSKLFNRNTPLIEHQNSVNNHLFKPFYSFQDSHLECFVSSEDVLKHTMNALFHSSIFYGFKIQNLTIFEEKQSISSLIKHWDLKNRVIICRVESLLTFLLIEWLHFCEVDFKAIKQTIVTFQRSRLSKEQINFDVRIENLLKSLGLNKNDFFDHFQICRQSTQSIFVYGFNFVYNQAEVSAVMIPWGVKTAEQLTQALYHQNPRLEKVFLVGGVGYIGNKEANVDDIFVPSQILYDENQLFVKEKIQSPISQRYHTKLFKNFNVVKGCIKSVVPNFGQSSMQKYKSVIEEIDAFDMEYEAVLKVTKKHQKSSFGSIFYIMDLPKKNIHLGDTYYRKDFLEALFGKYKRGKHFCYEKSLLFVSSK